MTATVLSRQPAQWKWLCATLLAAPLLLGLSRSHAEADKIVTAEEIEQALKKPKTRGLSLRATVETKEMIDLNVPFEFNSSELQPQAIAQLNQLQSALNSKALSDDRFLVAGHTDAKGSAQYNKQLSLRRAEAVKRFLVASGVAEERLEVIGRGNEQLLEPEHPDDAANRRVEIRNLGKRSGN